MERRTMRWPATLMLAVTMAARAAAGQPEVEAAGGALFSAEVTVDRSVVDERGKLVRDLPRSRFRIEQFAGGRSRMAMLAGTGGPRVGPLADPYAGMVVEFDPAGAGLRLLGPDGRPVAGVPPVPASFTPSELTRGEGLVTSMREAATRRGELARHFGTRTGSVRNLERYLETHGPRVHEVLVQPSTALPVEMNVVHDGLLEEHHEFTYDQRASGQIVRTRTRSESRVPGAKGQRLVSVTTLADVRVAGGAR